MKSIIAIAILLAPFAVQADDEQDAKDFAQALIQSRDYKCDKVTAFSTANFSGKAVVWCDDRYEYEITQPGGRWKVEAMN
ncbi:MULTISPECIES: hypothetical protein [Citrobacter]|uniref:hypothetical protein n=1 Tax=Citrobacter TaxID=544 RepID=UPI0006431C43|nr:MULTISPECIES: hypothetical protein [Citrobacter]EGT5657849.1 hypothetical protein [Citrobacter braakii]ELK6404956.1 hypothetical protein [Citrobacter freundii]ELN2653369.1 hypothetical protein [Citrobacter braakii]ELN4159093.1 hypothetical protein [Citrobacter braakii]ELQ7797908.1 hypothetical protein [Citrobacter freundii]